MSKLRLLGCLAAMAIAGASHMLSAMTEQQMLEEHDKWVKILGLQGKDDTPLRIYRYGNPQAFKKPIVDVAGHGLRVTFDAQTGGVLFIYNDYLWEAKGKEEKTDKKISFSLTREACKEALVRYYRLIVGEDPPDFEIKTPATGSLHEVMYQFGHGWPRTYQGYEIRDNFVSIGIFPDSGALAVYLKKDYSDIPPTVEVKTPADVARQKAVEITKREIRDWVGFLESLNTETAILKTGEAATVLKGKERMLQEQARQAASFLQGEPTVDKPPYLEIVNVQKNPFDRDYMRVRPVAWNSATRLCWIVSIRYVDGTGKVFAPFEVWIDANNGSLVGGSRPWN